MTTIAAKFDATVGDWLWGWDSQVSRGHYARRHNLSKVFKIDGGVTIGAAGAVSDANLVHFMKLVKRGVNESSYEYMVKKFVPTLRKTLDESGRLEVHDGVAGSDSGLLVQVGGDLFSVSHDFGVCAEDGYMALGSGAHFAIGAMEAGASVKKALKVAKKLDVYTGGELHFAWGAVA